MLIKMQEDKMAEMVIDSSVRETGADPIFKVAGAAAERTKELGRDAVINSTIGAFMSDEGKLVAFKTVYRVLRSLPDTEFAGYAKIAGLPEYLEAVQKACFKEFRPDGFIEAIATPGGTGAIRHTICNYSEIGDAILVPDWYWAPYKTIANENRRDLVEFSLFDQNGHFNLESYKKEFLALIKTQKRVVSIMNTPAHNPTGYSVTMDEWCALKDFYTETAEAHPDCKIIVLVDIAYIDFAGNIEQNAREFMPMLTNMGENVLPLYAYSASKSYTMYGLRNGALICVAPTKAIAEEFKATCTFSNRGTWSNGTRCAQKTIAEIFSDELILNDVITEQEFFRAVLQRRAEAFIEESEKIGLELCTYGDGFFISIPCKMADKVSDYLMKKNLFIVALKKGLRFAPCAVSENNCRKAPKMIKEAMNFILK